ncbi:MAG: hypothetical protein D6B25_11665 [Desulfobulbaceae bacterium]|nr:MAG: hypothetical protein D6B25_11665 [Desulfobulbaceae bacterium]
MYLAYFTNNGRKQYQIRQSFKDVSDDHYRHRTVFDLGDQPEDFLEILSEDICYFNADLEAEISQWTELDATQILEELLWDFLPEETQDRLSYFRHRGKVSVTPLSRSEKRSIEASVHLFDRRRLYYLRYGAVDQSRIFRLNPKLYRPLMNKSRDEIEYYFMDLEKVMEPNEMKTYVFAIFDLQRHFTQSYSATMPEALNQEDISDHFLDDLCALNDDLDLWPDYSGNGSLKDHLIRYLIMFFDHGYGRRSLFDDFVREFMGRHRTWQWPDKKPDMSTTAISEVFEKPWNELQKLNRKELTRLFRSRAKELHPDSGGDHEDFIRLSTAYAALLSRKK